MDTSGIEPDTSRMLSERDKPSTPCALHLFWMLLCLWQVPVHVRQRLFRPWLYATHSTTRKIMLAPNKPLVGSVFERTPVLLCLLLPPQEQMGQLQVFRSHG